MTEFREQDLTGAQFERVSLRGATFTQVYLTDDATMHAVDLTGAQRRRVVLHPDPPAPQLRQHGLGGSDDPRQRLAVAPVGPSVGRDARVGRHPVGPRGDAERDLTALGKEN
jgi:hypothetical protein